MKFIEDKDEKTQDGIPVADVAHGDIFQWDAVFWMQASDTRDEELRVVRVDGSHEDDCVGVSLETGQLRWIPGDTIVIPIEARIRIVGRSDKVS